MVTATGRKPLSTSAIMATANHPQEPVVRRTFMAPTLPVPCAVISSPVTRLTIRYALGTDPIR
jgi:hypothetical protein